MKKCGIKRPLDDTYDEENDKGEEESDGEIFVINKEDLDTYPTHLSILQAQITFVIEL